MPRAVVAAYLACALIWGTTWYAIRVSIAAYPTLAAVALRFAIAAAILLPIAARARPWPRGRAWGWLVLAGVLDAACYLLVYLGEERVPGAVAAVLYGTQPLILAVLLTAVRIERLTRRHLVGAAVSLAGVRIGRAWWRPTAAPPGSGSCRWIRAPSTTGDVELTVSVRVGERRLGREPPPMPVGQAPERRRRARQVVHAIVDWYNEEHGSACVLGRCAGARRNVLGPRVQRSAAR